MAPTASDSFDHAVCSLDALPAIEPGAPAVPGQPGAALARLATEPDEIHLWYALTDDARGRELDPAYDALMTDDERARQARYVREVDRDLHRLTRAVQRTVLSRYAPVSPRAWVFARDYYDKPSITGPTGVVWPRFNLSNAHGLVVCAVSTSVALLGVDAEPVEAQRVEIDSLADRFFAPAEAADLRAVPPASRVLRFLTYWTLKEAFIKACGQGLSIPLDQFAFQLAAGGAITATFDPALADDPAAWSYRLFRAADHHLVAIAARIGAGRALTIKASRCMPLRGALAPAD